jgi:hypothetical protein
MNDLAYFERLIRDLNDARQQQLVAYESLNFKNALNLASARISGMMESEISEALEKENHTAATLIKLLRDDIIKIVDNISNRYSDEVLKTSSKIEIVTEMMKIASNSSKSASDAAKIHAEKKESQSQSLEESSQKLSTLKVEKKIRKVGERPISIKSQRLNVEDSDGS